VLLLGADTPPDQVAETARDRRADLVALSTALPGHLLSASLTCSLLKRLDPAPFVVAGGQGYGGRRARALAVGADEYAPDPEALLAVLAARFGAADGRAAR
jgi:methanogenic corrinoid protein MtbC1